MSDGSWQEVLADYKFVQTESWGDDFVWMEKLVSLLLEKRDLSMLYPITSHYRLIAFIGTTFSEKYKRPKISIEMSRSQFTYKFSLIKQDKHGDFIREYVESVYCSFEKSLEVFDEMFEKLKAATETRLTIVPKD